MNFKEGELKQIWGHHSKLGVDFQLEDVIAFTIMPNKNGSLYISTQIRYHDPPNNYYDTFIEPKDMITVLKAWVERECAIESLKVECSRCHGNSVGSKVKCNRCSNTGRMVPDNIGEYVIL